MVTMLTKLIVVIISQYIQTFNHYVVYHNVVCELYFKLKIENLTITLIMSQICLNQCS